jgi:4-hydroxy-3-polyprenylbenzoate decarboxylase
MTGATGQLYGIVALELLETLDCETHLVLSDAAKLNIRQESAYNVAEIEALADELHDTKNIGASIASGSFTTTGMIITPCSMKTLSNIAHGNSGSLITRAADVTLKERRPLVLMPREKPLNRIHLQNMLTVTDAGAIVMPPFPSFYNRPESIEEMVTRTMQRTLSLLGLKADLDEWKGVGVALESSEK